MGRPNIAEKAIEIAERRISKDKWPEYYDTKRGRFIGKQARLCQTWSIAGYLVAKHLLANPDAAKILINLEDTELMNAFSCMLSSNPKRKRTRKGSIQSFISRKDVDGSLFVVKRNVQPRFQFIVINRRNTDNLVENLLGDFEYEIQVPYLLYRNASQECEEVANLFSRILNAYGKVTTKFKMPSGKSEFEELEAVPTMSVMDGPLEPTSATISNVTGAPDGRSFTNFFGAAMSLGSSTNGTLIPPSHPPCLPLAEPTNQMPTPPFCVFNVFKTLLGNPEDGHLNRTANLVKPSSFFSPQSSSALMVPPVSSSMPTAPPLDPSNNLQRPYGTPLLQPFPPPTPLPSLTPITPLL